MIFSGTSLEGHMDVVLVDSSSHLSRVQIARKLNLPVTTLNQLKMKKRKQKSIRDFFYKSNVTESEKQISIVIHT